MFKFASSGSPAGLLAAAALLTLSTFDFATASDFSSPWRNPDRALVIDAYEYNPIDWTKLATDKRIAGFINKGSDGLPPAYRCSGGETERRLCKALWKRYSVARELFHTRKHIAKSLGLKWGAYHLARPGNPIDQANHFIDFAEPGPDDLMALDLEGLDEEKWMSLEDAETFVRHIRFRTGRYPILYANDMTSQYIADNADKYRLLSRLPLWYARYKPVIGKYFPKGNWERYTLWQFSSQTNCGRRCPYRVAGTKNDIDVNVSPFGVDELRRAWPFGKLLDQRTSPMSHVPLPASRKQGLAGTAKLLLASVTDAVNKRRASSFTNGRFVGTAEYSGWLKDVAHHYRHSARSRSKAPVDVFTTASVADGKQGPQSPRPSRRLPRTEFD